jgi:hypothetical protein
MEPNTNIPIGNIRKDDIKFFVECYQKLELPSSSKLERYISSDNINNSNLKLREYEVTPDPHFRRDNKLLFGLSTNSADKKLYVNVQIHPGEDCVKNYDQLKSTYDKLVRDYYLSHLKINYSDDLHL